MWGHAKNARTDLWKSFDGIHFEYQGASVEAKNIACRNASYSRVYEFPLKQFNSEYIMLYSGFCEEKETRFIWLAHSKDAENWIQLQNPLVEPAENEYSNLYGASLFPWKNKVYIVYQNGSSWRGGNLKYVEVDSVLNPVGRGGERYVLINPGSGLPLNNRLRGAEFYREDDRIYMFSGASSHPRIIVYAIANE